MSNQKRSNCSSGSTSTRRGLLAAHLPAGHVNVALRDRQQACGAQARREEAKVGALSQQLGEPIGRRPDVQSDRLSRPTNSAAAIARRRLASSLRRNRASNAGSSRSIGVGAVPSVPWRAMGSDQRSVAPELIQVTPESSFPKHRVRLRHPKRPGRRVCVRCRPGRPAASAAAALAGGAIGGHVLLLRDDSNTSYRKRSLVAVDAAK